MKWIVKRDTYRNLKLADIEIIGGCKGAPALVKHNDEDDPEHPLNGKKVSSIHVNHIHKGAILEIGEWLNEEDFQKAKTTPLKLLVCELRYGGNIGDAADPVIVKRIEKELAEDVKREANRLARVETSREASATALRVEAARILQSR
jgi:hypothetical protein